jgi:hypothetical protein
MVDLAGTVPARELLPGGGWTGAMWLGCTPWIALDRTLGEERSLSVLSVESGQLVAVGPGPIDRWTRDPAILEALVEAFGVEEAYPDERLRFGALRADGSGWPAVELVGAGEGGRPDVVLGLESLELPAPVRRALETAGACAPGASVRWVMRSAYGEQTLPGEAEDWDCVRAAAEVPADAGEGQSAVTGVSAGGVADLPLVVEVPGAGEVPLAGSGPVEAYERCVRPGGGWQAVRVEQPGPYGLHVLYVVRDGDGAAWEAARYEPGGPVAAGIGVIGGTLLFGGPGGWWAAPAGDEPQRVGDFAPAVRPSVF